MRALIIVACIGTACVSAAQAEISRSWLTYSPRTIACGVFEADVAMGTYGGGNIAVSFGGKPLLNASLAGTWIDTRRCRRIRTRTVPKPVVPRPSYPMTQGEFYECPVSGPVVIHAHFLKSAGRLSGLYVSVRVRRTGRFVAAGVLTINRRGREYIGPTCKSR